MSVQQTQIADQAVPAAGRYIYAFNAGDGQAMDACFAVPGTILYGMAPHLMAKADSGSSNEITCALVGRT